MKFVSLFAGIGGFDIGLERAGHECSGQIEIDPFCRRVLAVHWPYVERSANVRTYEQMRREVIPSLDNGAPTECLAHGAASGIDLLCGGFPCQDLSVAGKRAGLAGERSGLFWEIVRIAKIIRPTLGLFENVPGLLSSQRGADMSSVISGLRECWPVVGYRIMDSRHFGVAQRRRRVFFVCGPSEAGVASVLFEPEGGQGNPTAGDEEGARVAASLMSGVGAASNDPGRRREDDVNLVVAHALSRPTSNGRLDPNGEDFVIQQCHGSNVGPMGELRQGNGGLTGGVPFVFEPKASAHQSMNPYELAPALGTSKEPGVFHSLSSEGSDASEDGTGRGTPMVVTALRHLGNGGPDDNEAQGGHLIPIQDVRGQRDKRQNGIGVGKEGDPMFTLDSVSRHAVGVRRLTPLECERLQGFPDGWTCLCLPLEAYERDPDEAAMLCKCPDSPRYRALGNAVTVNVIEWIGRRLSA